MVNDSFDFGLLVTPSARKGLKLGPTCDFQSLERQVVAIVGLLLVVFVLERVALLALSVPVAVRLSVSTRRENLERVERDFRHVALLSARLVCPASVSQASFDIEARSLADLELFDDIRNLAPAYDVVPLRVFFLFAVGVAVASRGGDGEGHALASADLAHADFGVLAEIAYEHYLV